MNQSDPLATWNKWVDDNPQALNWLYPTERDQMTALRTARELKILNSSQGAKYFDDVYERVGAGEKLLDEFMSVRTGRGTSGVEQARALMRQSDPEQRLALRETVYTKILEPAIENHDATGVKVINPKVLTERIKAAEKEGTLQGILTQRDREILDAAKLFARKTYKKGDAGTALAVASQIGQLRQADLKAVSSILFARNMAGIFTSTTISPEVLFSRLSRKPAASQQPYSTVLGSLARTVNRAGRLSLSTKEEQKGPENLSLPPQLGPVP
jgi:hypothetical protein